MTRVRTLAFAAALLATAAPAAGRPNIVFVFADDWGYGDLGCHGSTFCETPNLDRMAAEGTDFANFTVNSPVCTPSRVAVMTGRFPARFCIHQHFQSVRAHAARGMPDWLDPAAPMLPRLLRDAGYTTGHFGKWHLGSVRDSPAEGRYGYDAYATFNGSGTVEIDKGGLSSVDHAEAFIRGAAGRPFFVNLWLHEVHTPHLPQDRYLEKFAGLGEAERVYASVIAEGDEAVGRILALLKELEIDEETLLVFSTDNGPEHSTDEKGHKGQGLGKFYSVGETGGLKGEKRSLFAGGVRVPFLVRWPGVVPAGRKDAESVLTAVDLLPTFLEAAGVPLPEGLEPDGQSALAAFRGGPFARTKPIFWDWRGGDAQEYTWPTAGVRDGDWKLLIDEAAGRAELYDLRRDWAETTDVSADHPEVVARLREAVRQWKRTLPAEPDPAALSAAREKLSQPKKAKKSKRAK